MPRKTTLPSKEIEIGRRLRQLRENGFWSREEIARDLEIHVSTLMRVEVGTMPLRYSLAVQVHNRFEKLNPLWLAHGTEPQWLEWPLVLPHGRAIGVADKELYSAVISRFEGPLQSLLGPPETWRLPVAWLERLKGYFEYRIARLGWDIAEAEKMARVIKQSLGGAGASEESKAMLDKVSQPGMMAPMQLAENPVGSLLGRVRKHLARRGAQSELAHALGVTRQAVSNWVAGDAVPSAEAALHLLQWVEAKEAKESKQNSSDRVRPRPEPKTQLRTSHEKKSQSGRPKD